jgi:HAD superfamily hydrolase (TIGR01549 family)
MNLRAVLFDYGGTLDGPGRHWLPRFLDMYRAAGLALPFDRFRGAFDHATQCGYRDARVAGMSLTELIEFHVARQMEHLGVEDRALADRVVTEFVRSSRAALAESRALLERLSRHVALGVISNFYGNLERILADVGIAPLLTAIVDSARVGVHKPSPAIFTLAMQRMGCAPAAALYVGDSFEKDVRGARAAGLRTGWIVNVPERSCPSPELVDIRLRTLADIEAVIA